MSTSTRIMRSKGESDGLSLPTRMRPTRKDTTSGRNGGTALTIPGNTGWDQQQQMPTQMPHLTQSPQATSDERTTTLMLPPGPHRPLTPHMPLPASPTSNSRSSAPLFKEDTYSLTSEEESEADEVQTVFSSFYARCFCRFSCSEVCAGLGNGCERFCTSRSLLGSYVHQESI